MFCCWTKMKDVLWTSYSFLLQRPNNKRPARNNNNNFYCLSTAARHPECIVIRFWWGHASRSLKAVKNKNKKKGSRNKRTKSESFDCISLLKKKTKQIIFLVTSIHSPSSKLSCSNFYFFPKDVLLPYARARLGRRWAAEIRHFSSSFLWFFGSVRPPSAMAKRFQLQIAEK